MSTNIKFGTDGWRDIIADGFTFENVKIVTNAIGRFVLEKPNGDSPIFVGYDSRFLSEKFAKHCCKELINLGLKVQLSDAVIPTPVIAFWASKLKSNGAIQFTASHNPPEYCGLKYITNYGGPAPIEVTNAISEYIKKNKPLATSHQPPAIPTFNPQKEYLAHLKELIDFDPIKKSGLKVIYDPIYGAGNNYLDYILKEAGCEVISIHNTLDPLFGGLLPEPREEYLNDLKQKIKAEKANLGLATDGDADRLGAVDENGIFYSPNKIASMLLRHLIKNKKRKGRVVRTLSTTHLLDHLAKKHDLELVETQVGFKWICKEMLKGDVLIGAEESGGISILNHVPDKDAILAGTLLVEMMAYEKKTLKEIYQDTLKDANWICINDKFDLHVNEKQKDFLISKLALKDANQFKNLKIKSVNTIEGIKYLFDDGSWFLARASGTEPMARVYFEATSDKVLEIMKTGVKRIIDEACQK